MNNLKEESIRRVIQHIRRHLDALSNAQDTDHREYELFHLQTSIDCLERVVNGKTWFDKAPFKISSKGSIPAPQQTSTNFLFQKI